MKSVYYLIAGLLCFVSSSIQAQTDVEKNILSLTGRFADIPSDRRAELRDLASEIYQTQKKQGEVDVNFICSTNARRSQLAELWFNVATDYYGLDYIVPYSGGVRTTEFNRQMISALRRFGFTLEEKQNSREQPNPHYVYEPKVKYGKKKEMYSKKYDEQEIRLEDFVAVLVCGEADRDCPVVQGASTRFSLPYDSPKSADGTREEVRIYDDIVEEIGVEMMYLAQQIHVAGHQG